MTLWKKGRKKTIVGNPNNCMEFWTGCEGQCPVAGINLPSKKETRELIKKPEKN